MSLSTATEYARGMIDSGKLANVGEANVEIVRMMGVRIVTGSIPREVRSWLAIGVRAGKIGRLPKDGLLPEAFFHPNAKWDAMEQREKIANAAIASIAKVCGTSEMLA